MQNSPMNLESVIKSLSGLSNLYKVIIVLATLFGMFFLYLVYPKNVQYASETLTAPFMNLTKFLVNYYNLPPDR